MDKDKNEITMDRNKVGMISGVIGMFLNLVLCVFKIVVGGVAGSIAMVADGFNNLADIASNLASMIGFHLSKKPADSEHPFGHARFEYISGLVIGILIFFAAASLFLESGKKIFAGGELEYSPLAIIVLVVAIVVKLLMGFVNLHLSKKINSKTLRAVAVDSFSDTIATFGVVVAMLVCRFWDINIDGYVGCLVAIVIFMSGLNVLKDVLSSLLGEKITKEDAREMHDKICGFEGVLGLHDLMVHSYGEGQMYASAHVEMDAKIPPLVSHDIIDDIERDFAKNGVHLVLHYDPVELDNEKTNEYKKRMKEVLAEIGDELNLHDFRVVYSDSHTNLVFDLVVPYDFRLEPNDVLNLLLKEVETWEEKIFLVVDLDRSY